MHDRNRGKLSISMHSVQSKKRLKIKSIRGRLGRRDGVDRARLGSRPHWGIYRLPIYLSTAVDKALFYRGYLRRNYIGFLRRNTYIFVYIYTIYILTIHIYIYIYVTICIYIYIYIYILYVLHGRARLESRLHWGIYLLIDFPICCR